MFIHVKQFNNPCKENRKMKKCAIISGKELNAGDKMKQNTQGKRKQEEAKFLHSHYDL